MSKVSYRCSNSVALFFTLALAAVIVVNVFLFTAVVVISKLIELEPAGTVTLAGTMAREGRLLVSATFKPPRGAGPVRAIVPVAVPPPCSEEGLTVNTDSATGIGGLTVMVVDLFTPE